MLLLFLYRLYGDISQYVCIYKYIYTVLYVDYSYNPFTKWDAPASYSWWDVPVPPNAISTHEKTMNSFDNKRGLSKKVVVTVTFSVWAGTFFLMYIIYGCF